MKVNLDGVSRSQVDQLVAKLENELYPKECTIALIAAHSTSGSVVDQKVRLELAPSLPGVLLPLPIQPQYIDWAVKTLVELAHIHMAP